MTSTLKDAFISFIFEHRRGLVGIPGLAALFILWKDIQVIPVETNGNYTVLVCAITGTILILSGVVIRLWAGLYISGHKNSDLITGGPYSLIRNPLYAGNMISALGVMLMTQSPTATLVVMVALSIIYVSAIAHEEKKLVKLFGNDYVDYLQSTPRLIPRRKALRALLSGAERGGYITYRNLARELKRGGIFMLTGFLVLLGVGAMH